MCVKNYESVVFHDDAELQQRHPDYPFSLFQSEYGRDPINFL
jgi:hypothetical protein